MNEDIFELVCPLVPEGEANHFHMANLPGEEFRDVLLQTPADSAKLKTKIKITELHHGKLQDENSLYEATLLVFTFEFMSRTHEHQYKYANATIEFVDKGNKREYDPKIYRLRPYGSRAYHQTEVERKVTQGASLGAQAGPGIATAKASIHADVETSQTKDFHVNVMGDSGRSEGQNRWDNEVSWSMEENTEREDGIPTFLQAAVLLQRRNERPFVARLRLKTKVNWLSHGLRAISYKTDVDPVIDHVVLDPRSNKRVGRKTELPMEKLERLDQLDMDHYYQVGMFAPDKQDPAQLKLSQPESKPAVEDVPSHKNLPTEHGLTGHDSLQSAIAASLRAAKAASSAAAAAAEASASAVAIAEVTMKLMNLSERL